MANSLETSTTVAASALNKSNDDISTILLNVKGLNAGDLMKELTNQQAVSSMAQGALNKIKDEVKAVTGFGR